MLTLGTKNSAGACYSTVAGVTLQGTQAILQKNSNMVISVEMMLYSLKPSMRSFRAVISSSFRHMHCTVIVADSVV